MPAHWHRDTLASLASLALRTHCYSESALAPTRDSLLFRVRRGIGAPAPSIVRVYRDGHGFMVTVNLRR